MTATEAKEQYGDLRTFRADIDILIERGFIKQTFSGAPFMKANKWGRVINLNSIHGLVASEFKSAYVSAKHGLSGLTKTAALEGGPLGITVNSICPSYVQTPLVDKQIAAQAATHGISEEEVVSKIMLQKAAVKKLLQPNEVASVVKFLCTDEASMITGSTMTIDGGWTAA